MVSKEQGWVAVGRLQGAFGVKGWARILSFTDPPERILTFPTWWLGRHLPVGHPPGVGFTEVVPLSGQKHGRGVVALLRGVENPEAAQALSGSDVWIPRENLPEPEEGAHYWADMVGMQVVTQEGERLGTVAYLFATGANDVLVVQEADGGERLLPFTREVVRNVDRNSQTMTVSLMPGM
ncbi:MAG: 16S rRNA processing protein RimM [Magnetococcales bacterium]|nr:16S rRNA processing protein RimM [Magnetococcales bacterium]